MSDPRTGISYLPKTTVDRINVEGNKIEKTKLEKDPSKAWTDLYEYAAAIRSETLTWEELEAGDANIRLKWCGLLSRFKKVPGTFMMRLRKPNGILRSDALRLYADALEDAAITVGQETAVADITTRQNLQLRGLTLDQAADLIAKLPDVNVTCHQSAMDNVRNIVGSPLAGIDQDELLDTRPYCNALNDLITIDPDTNKRGNPKWGNLPRKFNIAVSSSPADYAHAKINDLAFEAATHNDGNLGFNVVVGGYFSARRSTHAIDLGLWIPASVSNVLDVSTAILEIFRDEGFRGDRQKARFMWLVEACGGADAFKLKLLEKLKNEFSQFPIDQVDTHQNVANNAVSIDRKPMIGVFPQQSQSLSRVGMHVPVGRLSLEELRALADAAEQHSGSELRLTVEQNVIFPNVKNPHALIEQLGISASRLSATPGPVSGNTVSCTGSQFCPLAIIETKAFATRISQRLDDALGMPLRLHVTGCPNSCGQVQMADIGLMGAPARRIDPETGKAKAVPGCNVFLGGTIGHNSKLSLEPVLKGLPIDDEDELVGALIDLIEKEKLQATAV